MLDGTRYATHLLLTTDQVGYGNTHVLCELSSRSDMQTYLCDHSGKKSKKHDALFSDEEASTLIVQVLGLTTCIVSKASEGA